MAVRILPADMPEPAALLGEGREYRVTIRGSANSRQVLH
jgi:hypothetical protein